ncbi:hypothetical protein K439DRAFT_1620602 [Ramaria rubella]|nr:hypothetical protein K439DRAFT_1620602 [Ramaria rubella]
MAPSAHPCAVAVTHTPPPASRHSAPPCSASCHPHATPVAHQRHPRHPHTSSRLSPPRPAPSRLLTPPRHPRRPPAPGLPPTHPPPLHVTHTPPAASRHSAPPFSRVSLAIRHPHRTLAPSAAPKHPPSPLVTQPRPVPLLSLPRYPHRTPPPLPSPASCHPSCTPTSSPSPTTPLSPFTAPTPPLTHLVTPTPLTTCAGPTELSRGYIHTSRRRERWRGLAEEGPAKVAATKEEMEARRRAQEDPLRIMEWCQVEVEATNLHGFGRTSPSPPTSPHQRDETLGEVLSTQTRAVVTEVFDALQHMPSNTVSPPLRMSFYNPACTPTPRSSSFALADSWWHWVSSTRQHMPLSPSPIYPDASAPGVRR